MDPSMSETHCPICATALETIEVAPCYDCGHDPDELRQLAAGEHTYDEVEVLGARAVLCNFCQADFTSYDPTYFGRPLGTPVGRHMELVRVMQDPRPAHDKFCPSCNRRLAFLQFVMQARVVAAP